MTASVAAATLAVSVLDAARRGRPPRRRLDAHHLAVAATSERYASRLGSDLSIGFAPLSRFWPAADGCDPAARELPLARAAGRGRPRRRPRRRRGSGGHRRLAGRELEEALAAAGALGFAVRDLGAWRRHPQGAALAAAPLIERAPGLAARP